MGEKEDLTERSRKMAEESEEVTKYNADLKVPLSAETLEPLARFVRKFPKDSKFVAERFPGPKKGIFSDRKAPITRFQAELHTAARTARDLRRDMEALNATVSTVGGAIFGISLTFFAQSVNSQILENGLCAQRHSCPPPGP